MDPGGGAHRIDQSGGEDQDKNAISEAKRGWGLKRRLAVNRPQGTQVSGAWKSEPFGLSRQFGTCLKTRACSLLWVDRWRRRCAARHMGCHRKLYLATFISFQSKKKNHKNKIRASARGRDVAEGAWGGGEGLGCPWNVSGEELTRATLQRGGKFGGTSGLCVWLRMGSDSITSKLSSISFTLNVRDTEP